MTSETNKPSLSHSKTGGPWRLAQLAAAVEGELDGDGSVEIRGVAPIERAGADEITFVANPKYLSALKETGAAAVVLAPGIPSPLPAIRSPNPYLAFAKIATLTLQGSPAPVGVSADLIQGEGCQLGKGLSIHPRVTLGDRVHLGHRVTLYPGVIVGDGAVIGEDSVLHANVSVREGVRIGARVVIHDGAVIGSDGFGFAPDGERYFKIPQMGGVVIGDDVEIGANTTIDRGTLGDTVIGAGTKIDNLVQIAHNVEIGENSIIVSQVGISGSTVIGKHVTLAGQVGVAGHLGIGDNVIVGAQSGVTKDIAAGETVSGLPVIPHRDWLKAAASFTHLPAIRRELRKLQQTVRDLAKEREEGEHHDGRQ